MTHICVGKLSIIGSENGLSPGRRQAIIWTNAEILLMGPLGTDFSEILIGIQIFLFKKLHLKTSSAKWRLSCLGLSELISSLWPSDGTWRRGAWWHQAITWTSTDILKSHSKFKCHIFGKISFKHIPRAFIDDESVLGQVKVWCLIWTSDDYILVCHIKSLGHNGLK